jgi:3-oxoacyl-[acyl-carrier protein] reductase
MEGLAQGAEDALGGPIDILFNNHGGPPLRKAMEVTQAELTDHANKMLLSLVRITQIMIPGMVERKWGRVFMVGASAVAEPIPANVLSNMFRAAMAYYCKSLANDVIKDGVTVNIVSPTAILTDRTLYTAATFAEKKGITQEEELALRESKLPAGRFGKPEEYGAMVAYLSGQNAGYNTGANWRVDGGGVKGI